VDIYFPKETKEIRDIEVNVTPTEEQDRLRKELVKTYYYKQDEENFELEIKSGAALLVKLQQLSDGFLRDKEGNYILIKSSKMRRLKELCNELLNAVERILIWVAFRKTAAILSRMLPYKTTILSGDGKFDVFGWRDKKINITLATVGSGASLNDFADVQYSIFYSTSFSSLNLQQSKGRTNRKSTLHNCCYYYFLGTNKFPDKQIYQMIEDNKGKEDIVKAVSKRVLTEYTRETSGD
jgi:ERCC4-related helicase